MRISERHQTGSNQQLTCEAQPWLKNSANLTVPINQTRTVVQSLGTVVKVDLVQSNFYGIQRVQMNMTLKFQEFPKNETRILPAIRNDSVNHFILTAQLVSANTPYKNETILPKCSTLTYEQVHSGIPCVQITAATRTRMFATWKAIQLSSSPLECFEDDPSPLSPLRNKIAVHESYGYVTSLVTKDERSTLDMHFSVELMWWTDTLATRFLNATAEVNYRLSGVQLESFLALPIVTDDPYVEYFTKGKFLLFGFAALVVINILVLIWAVIMRMCTRSFRTFDYAVWAYVARKKERMKMIEEMKKRKAETDEEAAEDMASSQDTGSLKNKTS